MTPEKRIRVAGSPTSATEELLAKPLADFVRDLGLGIAEANKALIAASQADPSSTQVCLINSAEIEVAVAIAIQKSTDTGGGITLGLSVFSMNASYKSTFSFKEEASSKIKVSIATRPRGA